MSQKQKEWLVRYLVSHDGHVMDSETIADHIIGMNADELIQAMDEARLINERLRSTPLGKELN